MATHLTFASHPGIGAEEPRTADPRQLNCSRCIRTTHAQIGVNMGKISDEFRIDASQADRIVIALNRDQAEKLATVLDLCVNYDMIEIGWDEPETAELVRDLGDHIRDLTHGRPSTGASQGA